MTLAYAANVFSVTLLIVILVYVCTELGFSDGNVYIGAGKYSVKWAFLICVKYGPNK